MNKVVNYLALDIDGVLNSSETFAKTRELINKYGDIHENDEKYVEAGIKWLYREGSDGKMHATDHVDLFKLNSLKAICDQHDVKVIGISSWFTGNRDLNELSKWLGLNVIAGGFSGSGQSRLHQVAEYLSEHEDLSNTDINLVYLDDDCGFDSTTKSGYRSLNNEAFKLLTSTVNTLFVFTDGRAGTSSKQFERIRQFYSTFNSKYLELNNLTNNIKFVDGERGGNILVGTRQLFNLIEDTNVFNSDTKLLLIKDGKYAVTNMELVTDHGADYWNNYEYGWVRSNIKITSLVYGDAELAELAYNHTVTEMIKQGFTIELLVYRGSTSKELTDKLVSLTSKAELMKVPSTED